MRSYEDHIERDLRTTISTIRNTFIYDVYFYYFVIRDLYIVMDLSLLRLFSSFHLEYLTLPCGIIPLHRLSCFWITLWKLIKPFELSWNAYIRIISSFGMTILSHCELLHFDDFGWDSTFILFVVLTTCGFIIFLFTQHLIGCDLLRVSIIESEISFDIV